MCLLRGMNKVFISQKTAFFIVTAVKTSNLTITTIPNHRLQLGFSQAKSLVGLSLAVNLSERVTEPGMPVTIRAHPLLQSW
jgi:hypothetical protein